MKFIDLPALLNSGRQCGVVVFAAGVVHGFTMPESVAVGVMTSAAGAAFIIINSILWGGKK